MEFRVKGNRVNRGDSVFTNKVDESFPVLYALYLAFDSRETWRLKFPKVSSYCAQINSWHRGWVRNAEFSFFYLSKYFDGSQLLENTLTYKIEWWHSFHGWIVSKFTGKQVNKICDLVLRGAIQILSFPRKLNSTK